MTKTNIPENFLKQRTAERSENVESLLSKVHASEDWAKPLNEKSKISSAGSSKRENNSRTDRKTGRQKCLTEMSNQKQ